MEPDNILKKEKILLIFPAARLFLVGEIVSESPECFVVTKTMSLFAKPSGETIGIPLLPDKIEAQVTVPKSNCLYVREPDLPPRVAEVYESAVEKARAAEAGIVIPSTQIPPKGE